MATADQNPEFQTRHFEALWVMNSSELEAEKALACDAILDASKCGDSVGVEKLGAYITTLSFLLSIKQRGPVPAQITAPSQSRQNSPP